MSSPLQFKDLAVGQKFTVNGENFTKIPDERITCCKVMNAVKETSNEKTMIMPLQEVQIVN